MLYIEDCERLWGKKFTAEIHAEAERLRAGSPVQNEALTTDLILAVAVARILAAMGE